MQMNSLGMEAVSSDSLCLLLEGFKAVLIVFTQIQMSILHLNCDPI